MYNLGLIQNLRGGADGAEVLKMHAISRIFFNNCNKKHPGIMGKGGPKAVSNFIKYRRK